LIYIFHIIDSIFITDKKFVNWTLQVASVHAQKAALPFIKSVEVNAHVDSLSACFIIHLYPHLLLSKLAFCV
jgi:mono-ADP-ribosyltransferase sirtuin 6